MRQGITLITLGRCLFTGLLVAATLPPVPSFGQGNPKAEISSSFNPVGSGARALGMGGAFIAVADDATAASWNPGGLILLETPEVSIVGAYSHQVDDNHFSRATSEDAAPQSVSDSNINYLSAAYPFSLGQYHMIVSLTYQHLYDFERQWDLRLNQQTGRLTIDQDLSLDQTGRLSALGLASCVQVTPGFWLGFTLNTWDDGLLDNEWTQKVVQRGTQTYPWNGALVSDPFEISNVEHHSFSGKNINLGFMWRIDQHLSIAGVLKTPFDADVERTVTTIRSPQESPTTTRDDATLTMPMSYGLGISYRFSDAFSASIDVYRTEWDDFLFTDSRGHEVSFITGRSKAESKIDPTVQVRVGAEYLFIGSKFVVPLRGGLFYDPAPGEGEPDKYYGVTIGSGIAWGRIALDVAYQYRWGNSVGAAVLNGLGFSQDVQSHLIYTSVIFYMGK